MQQVTHTPRAPRYGVSASMTYRRVGDSDWLEGRTVNVSRTGILFTATPPVVPAAARIEFILQLPSPGLPGGSPVKCTGRVVRQCGEPVCGEPACGECALAATIEAYHFLGIASETIC